jgi:hypothetical protein
MDESFFSTELREQFELADFDYQLGNEEQPHDASFSSDEEPDNVLEDQGPQNDAQTSNVDVSVRMARTRIDRQVCGTWVRLFPWSEKLALLKDIVARKYIIYKGKLFGNDR